MLVKSRKLKIFLLTLLTFSIGCLFISGLAAGVEPIKIGAPLPLTGFCASDGEDMLRALQLGVEEINAQGGVLGRPLELITGDIGDLEAEKISAVGEMLIGRGVDLVITGYTDGGVDTMVFGQYDVPFIHGDTMLLSTQPVMENPEKYWNVFQFDPNETSYGYDAVKLFGVPEKMGYEAPNKKVAIIVADYVYNIEAQEIFETKAIAQGYEVVIKELVTLGGNLEWGPVLAKIMQEKPAFVTFWDLDAADAARFMLQWKDRFMANPMDTLVFVRYTPNIPEFLDLVGDAADGVLWVVNMKPYGPDYEAYEARWMEKFGAPVGGAYGGYLREGLEIWREAVERVGDVKKYREICTSIKEYPYQCKYSNNLIVFDPHYQCAIQGEGLTPVVWHQIQNGKHYMVAPEICKEAEMELPPWMESK